ncbi:MAG: efflux RND transporter permease subunit [Bacteroidales bacterium]
MIFVEFNTNVNIQEALIDVKDAIDKAKSNLPGDLMADPVARDLDFNSFPILNINLSGEYSLPELKRYADYLSDALERVYQISRVNISGVDERRILVELDLARMEALGISFTTIENIVRMENVTLAGGELKLGNTRRSVRTIGEFESLDELRNIIIRQDPTHTVYLRDVAEVTDGFEDKKSYARLDGNPVVTLGVVKKSGENLITAATAAFKIMESAIDDGTLPPDLRVDYTFDQSKNIKSQLSNLENSIIMGVILVVTVLFFFLGMRNALIVGISIPLSMLITFVFLNLQNSQVNMIVLFSLILALGMLVDNAIVVVENITRYRDRGNSRFEAARQAVGEIAGPIITSTLTTLAAFLPLIFWGGMVGEFMKYMPITLIVVLSSSLLVALIFVPVFTHTFDRQGKKEASTRRFFIIAGALALITVPLYITGSYLLANLLMLVVILMVAHQLVMKRVAKWFQEVFLIWLENGYDRIIRYTLAGRRPVWVILGMVGLFMVTLAFFGMRMGEVRFFPEGEPNNINIVADLPLGTDIDVSDSVARMMEQRIKEVIGEERMPVVESMLTTVGQGVRRSQEFAVGDSPHRAMVQLYFIDFVKRNGISTTRITEELSDAFIDQYPGVDFYLELEQRGPPTGIPINIEITGKDFDQLLAYSDTIIRMIESSGIQGIEGLKTDIELGKPELLVRIDRDKAMRYGLSTLSIASTIRTALFGKEISDFKVGEEEFPIQIRLAESYRNDLSLLMNQKITYMNSATGMMGQIPISAVATFEYGSTYGSVNRIDVERVVTVYSNVVAGYNSTSINQQISTLLADLPLPDGYVVKLTGEAEETAETSNFMLIALLLVMSLMMIILVTQFNSFIKPLIILASVFFSIIGVFGGLATFRMDFVIMMTGIGILSLAGVVVNNAIVLVDYITLLKKRKRAELGLEEDDLLPPDVARDCIEEAGKTRLRPVLLTAVTTILGLLPLAIGLNIDFVTLFTQFDPNIYFGGDNAMFWGPLATTVVFGLAFATIITLLVVPAMYQIAASARGRFIRKRVVNS